MMENKKREQNREKARLILLLVGDDICKQVQDRINNEMQGQYSYQSIENNE